MQPPKDLYAGKFALRFTTVETFEGKSVQVINERGDTHSFDASDVQALLDWLCDAASWIEYVPQPEGGQLTKEECK